MLQYIVVELLQEYNFEKMILSSINVVLLSDKLHFVIRLVGKYRKDHGAKKYQVVTYIPSDSCSNWDVVAL